MSAPIAANPRTRSAAAGPKRRRPSSASPFLGRLPLSSDLRAASDAGTPPAAGDGPEAEAFARLADKLLEALDTAAA